MTAYMARHNKLLTRNNSGVQDRVAKIVKSVTANPIFFASLNLILSASITAVLGFAFWLRVARTFNANSVGLATSLLAVSSLISLLGLAGYDSVFIRYLPKAKDKNSYLNT